VCCIINGGRKGLHNYIQKLKKEKDIEGLLKVIQRNYRLRRKAAAALSELGWAPSNPEEEAWYHIAEGQWDKVLEVGVAAIKPLREARRTDIYLSLTVSECIRKIAFAELGWPPGKESDQLIRLIRFGRREKLVKLGEAAFGPLIYCLKYDTPRFRANAAKAMGELKIQGAVDLLLEVLERDRYWVVRRRAIKALEKIGDTTITQQLLRVLREDVNRSVRRAAAKALSKISEKHIIDLLIVDTRGKHWLDRWSAVVGLGEIGDSRAAEPLIQVLRSEKHKSVRKEVVNALAKMKSPQTIKLLSSVLEDTDHDARRDAIEIMKLVGDGQFIEPLINALNDEHWEIREAAASTLGVISDSRAIAPLLQAIKDDSSHDFKWYAENAIQNIRKRNKTNQNSP